MKKALTAGLLALLTTTGIACSSVSRETADRCRPVEYTGGLWVNAAGDIVGWAPTEDSDIAGLGGC